MHRYCRSPYLTLLAAVLALASFGSAVAQSDPVVGSTNVAIGDPPIPRPPSAPWDGFHNYASSVADDTVQLLP